MLAAIRELLATGASAREVTQAIARRQAEGQLGGLAAPSESTVKSIAREMVRDDSDPWTLEDATPPNVRPVLTILSAVSRASHGRIRHLTRREAQLAAVFLAMRPERVNAPWHAYVQAREYLAAANRGEDLSRIELDLFDMAELDEAIAGSASPAR